MVTRTLASRKAEFDHTLKRLFIHSWKSSVDYFLKSMIE